MSKTARSIREADVRAAAEALGVEIEFLRDSGRGFSAQRFGRCHEVTLDAPVGHHFLATGTHRLVATGRTPAECWRSAMSDLEYGVEACDPEDEECQAAAE